MDAEVPGPSFLHAGRQGQVVSRFGSGGLWPQSAADGGANHELDGGLLRSPLRCSVFISADSGSMTVPRLVPKFGLGILRRLRTFVAILSCHNRFAKAKLACRAPSASAGYSKSNSLIPNHTKCLFAGRRTRLANRAKRPFSMEY
jgi:hypothetical protein